MKNKLHYETVTPLLKTVLQELMAAKEFISFRLVGGTALSLQKGHRMSAGIDLFTDATYGSVDFKSIETYLQSNYNYVSTSAIDLTGNGKSYFTGIDENNCIKLDIYYTDPFIREIHLENGIRMASVEEIIAMKLDVILRGGRKKDYRDIHELISDYSFEQMLALHQERHPFNHEKELIRKCFTDFKNADEDFDPVCLKKKYWEVIKLDLAEWVEVNC